MSRITQWINRLPSNILDSLIIVAIIGITGYLSYRIGYGIGTFVGFIGLLFGVYRSNRQSRKRDERERTAHLEESFKAVADSIFHYGVHNGLYFHDVERKYGKLLVLWSVIRLNNKINDIYQLSMYFRPLSKKDDHIAMLKHASWWRYCVIVQRFGSGNSFRYGVSRECENDYEYSRINKYGNKILPIITNKSDYEKIIFSLGVIESSDELEMRKFDKNWVAFQTYLGTGRKGTFEDDLEIVKKYPSLVTRDYNMGLNKYTEI